MARLYGRRYSLKIGDNAEYLDISLRDDARNSGNSLRILFLIQHDFNGYASYAEITVFNLTPENENKIFERYRSIELQAGWPELFGPIFKGQIINIQRIPVGSSGTRGVRIFCRSGGQELDQSFINQSFGPSTPISEIIRTLAATYGFPVEFVGDFSALPLRSGGTVLQGDPKAYLQSYKKTYGFKFIIENNVMLIVKDGAVREGEMFNFSARTGMIGSPTVTDNTVEVRVALNPAVQLNRLIRIESVAPEFAFSGAYFYNVPRSIGEGVYEVATMNHLGDSHGSLWETQLSCFRYNAAQRNAESAAAAEAGL